MKKQRTVSRKRIFPVFLFFVGLLVLLYPKFPDWRYKNSVQVEKLAFEQQIKEKPYENLYQELQRRNEKLYLESQKTLSDPWSYEQPGIDLTEYGLEGNIIGFISIPKMEVELPIFLGASEENMSQGAVHLTETSYPIGGNNTNSVIAAHRGAYKTSNFRDIEKLEIGDKIYIRNFCETLTYRVVELMAIEPMDIDKLLIQENRDLITLITCHPIMYNYSRYVVFCEREED